jgi:mitochondrial GTPase 1
MVGGVPNVGKSTIINSLRKRDGEIKHTKKSGAKTGGIPCITKSISGFRIMTDPPTYMIDAPGIIVPRIDSTEDGLKLCACNCIRDGIVEPETVVDYVLFTLNKHRQFAYVTRYKLKDNLPTDSSYELIFSVQ